MKTRRTNLRGRIRWVAACLWMMVAACGAADRAYWVWGKRGELTLGEALELQHQGVRTLYWHVATVDGNEVRNQVSGDLSDLVWQAPDLEVVPVVRVEPGRTPTAASFRELRGKIPALQGEKLQIDFDCPD